jgi:hypothetical protein
MSPGSNESRPSLNQRQPIESAREPDEDGHLANVGSPTAVAFIARFAAAVSRLWIDHEKWDFQNSVKVDWKSNCTGFMVAPRVMLTAGHCLEPFRPSSAEAAKSFSVFFDRIGCVPKYVHFGPDFVIQSQWDDSIDAAVLHTNW